MAEVGTHPAVRKFNKVDAMRVTLFLTALAVVFAGLFFLLPWIQRLFLPSARPATDHWVVRPHIAFRFCACAILSALSLPVLLRPVQKRWRAQDAASGTVYVPFQNRPFGKVGILISGSLLAVIYASALAFYLSSWTVVSTSGIESRAMWKRRSHSFDHVRSLDTIPAGMRSDKSAQDGPWYCVSFDDGSSFTFSEDNEGCSDSDLVEIAEFISTKAQRQRYTREDARPQ